eukprot:49193-Eustigmatos_ZCMA.PRE.1
MSALGFLSTLWLCYRIPALQSVLSTLQLQHCAKHVQMPSANAGVSQSRAIQEITFFMHSPMELLWTYT